MVKNFIIGAYTLLLVLAVIALASGRMAMMSVEDREIEKSTEILQQAIEMHKPEILRMGEREILHIPTSKISGKNWSVNHAFYIYKDGTLKRIDFNNKQ